jgi:hypothetical protein
MTPGATTSRVSARVGVLVGLVVAAATVSFLVAAGQALDAISDRPATFAGFLAVTVALQLMAVRIRGRGAISVAGIAFLATGFTFGPGGAIVSALVAAAVHALRSQPPLHRAAFNAGAFSLAAAAGSGLYHLLEDADSTTGGQLLIALASGGLFALLNVGLLTLAMGISERRSLMAVWSERLRWLTPYYVAFGLLALLSTLAYEDFGFLALLALALPAALLVLRAALPMRLGSVAS